MNYPVQDGKSLLEQPQQLDNYNSIESQLNVAELFVAQLNVAELYFIFPDLYIKH
jgi:hypothetical protein